MAALYAAGDILSLSRRRQIRLTLTAPSVPNTAFRVALAGRTAEAIVSPPASAAAAASALAAAILAIPAVERRLGSVRAEGSAVLVEGLPGSRFTFAVEAGPMAAAILSEATTGRIDGQLRVTSSREFWTRGPDGAPLRRETIRAVVQGAGDAVSENGARTPLLTRDVEIDASEVGAVLSRA